MDVEYLRRCLLLQSLPGLSSPVLSRLLQHCGGVEALWVSEPRHWPAEAAAMACRFQRLRDSDRPQRPGVDVTRQLETLLQCCDGVLCVCDEHYPPLLRTLHDPPPLLYLRGDGGTLLRPQLAVVGARKASSQGLRAARELSAAVAEAGLVVTSGLALGIDGEAHRGALEGGGFSVAVMGTGIDEIYPRRHRALAETLMQSGCLVTELPPGSPPLRENFPRRNRVISGLSLGVLVVEASLPSGSLITAGAAVEQGREVFTLPWSIYHVGGRGCLHLLRDGAAMVGTVEDLLQELGPLLGLQRELTLSVSAPVPAATDPADDPLLQLIGDGTASPDELSLHSGQGLPRVLANLSRLEQEGKVQRTAAGYRRRQT